MNNKKPNRQQVNKVRRKADEQDITLGSRSSLPEDKVKSLRKRGTQLEIKHTRKPRQTGEQEEIRTGRHGGHGVKKSDIEKEFTRELQKIRNKLRYREKQGFWVKWETLPARPSQITHYSLDRLKQYQIQLNELGEIEVKRLKYGEQARQLRIPKEQLPNYQINNEEEFKPPVETTQQFNVLENIKGRLEKDMDILSGGGIPLDHLINPSQEEWWIMMTNARLMMLADYYDYFMEMANGEHRLEYADYLMAHEEIILEDIDIIAFDSNQTNVDNARFRMGEYFYLH